MNIDFTFLGRPEGIAETRDCTVRAFAAASGTPYERVHAAFKANGRKDRRGVRLREVAQRVAKDIGVTLYCVRRSGSLARFVKDFPVGSYIVTVRGHAFAVVNGVVVDNQKQSALRLVKIAWRVSSENQINQTK